MGRPDQPSRPGPGPDPADFARLFARTVEHDLRASLNQVAAFAEALRQDLGPRLTGADEQHLGHLVTAADDARARLQRLGEWGRLSLGTAPLPELSLAHAVDDALEGLAREGLEAAARVQRCALPRLTGSRELLTRLYRELVHNALLYGGAGAAPVRLTCASVGDEVVLGVLDAGPGIPEAQRERALRPLERLVPPRKPPGSGMGLALAARIVELHGGRLWLEGRPGEGTHVRFVLRAQAPAAPGR